MMEAKETSGWGQQCEPQQGWGWAGAGCFLGSGGKAKMSTLLPVEGRWEDGIWAGQGGKSRVTGSLGESGHPRGGGPRAEQLALD